MQPVKVEGTSMLPRLHDGELIFVNKLVYYHWPKLDRGDIVVFWFPDDPDKSYIKRVIGLPGDRFEVRNDHVYINDIELVEPYLDAGTLTDCGIPTDWCGRGPIEIPEGSVMALGDNRNNSDDSRSFGPVPIDNIIGKAWITYWPSDNIGIADHFDYPELDGSAAGAQWERSVAGWPASSQVGGARVGHGV